MCLYVPLTYRYISLATEGTRKWSFELRYYELEEDIDVIYPNVSFRSWEIETQKKGLHFLAFFVSRERWCYMPGDSGVALLALPSFHSSGMKSRCGSWSFTATFLPWEILEDGKPCAEDGSLERFRVFENGTQPWIACISTYFRDFHLVLSMFHKIFLLNAAELIWTDT